MEHASEATMSMTAPERRVKQMEGFWSPLSSRTPTVGLMSAAEIVAGAVGVDADDATRNDGVDVALMSSPGHITEQLIGITEGVFCAGTAVAAADSRI
jgi:hypothetical protein